MPSEPGFLFFRQGDGAEWDVGHPVEFDTGQVGIDDFVENGVAVVLQFGQAGIHSFGQVCGQHTIFRVGEFEVNRIERQGRAVDVVAFFGSEGLYCYNTDGLLLWKRDFGLINSAWNVVESAEWEFCSSPIIFQERLIIQVDALNTAFVAVLDLSTGETIWNRKRDEISGWCTPNIYFDGDKARIALNGFKHRGGYDLETGEEIWKMAGGGDIPIPTPIVWKDLVYFNSAHGRHAPLMAVKNNARGIITYPDHDSVEVKGLAWFYDRGGAYMSSVLVYDSLLYRLRWNGNLACFDARSGKEVYSETVYPSSFIASPVAADGKIYLLSEEGDLYIVRSGTQYKLLKKIPLGEVSLVTPSLAPGMLVLRTASRLIAVSTG